MPCDRVLDIDLAAFLAEPESPTWADFRAHRASCPDCRAELERYRELRAMSDRASRRAGAADAPPPELVARYAEAPNELGPPERARMEAALARPGPVRDELAVVRDFDFGRVEQADAPETEGAWAAAAEALGRILRSPVFAYGLALLLAIPLLADRGGPEPGPGGAKGPGTPRTVSFVSQRVVETDYAPTRPLRVLVPRPPRLAGEEVELRVADASGRRELIERVRAGQGPAGPVALEIPGAWLRPGAYDVRVTTVGEAPAPAPTYELRVGGDE